MAYNDLRAAIKTLVETVSDTGTVHNRERWADSWPTFLDQFKATVASVDVIRGWQITRTRKVLVPAEGADRQAAADYNNEFLIRGVMGFNDSGDTEGTFQQMVDDIVTALNGDKNLSGAANVVDYGATPAECRIIEPRMFGRVLCHYAEIVYRVRTHESF